MKRVLLAAALAVAMPTTALAAPPDGGHAESDPQATKQQPNDGPARPGLAWMRDLGVELANEPTDYVLTADNKVLVQGRAVSDVPGTPEDESASSRGYLMAIDPTDGSDAWPAPAMDVDYECMPAVTSDGRIIAHWLDQSPTNPDHDDHLMALDAATGQRLPGQVYDGEAQDGERLNPCRTRIVLSPDESLAFVQVGGAIRAIDIASWTQAFNHPVTEEGGGSAFMQHQLVVTDDAVFFVYRRDTSTSPNTWTMVKLGFDGNRVDEIDLPGQPRGAEALVAVGGAVLVGLEDCYGSGNTDDCLVRVNDDGGSLSLAWTTRFDADDASTPNRLDTIAVVNDRLVAGWAAGDLVAFDVRDGSIAWQHDPSSFTNNGGQLVTDPDGNLYYGTFGGNYVESVSPDGKRRWDLDPCHLESASRNLSDLKNIGPIAANGTLFARSDGQIDGTSTEVLLGFHAASDLPKGECPEQEERLAGATRVETSVEISGATFPAAGSADTVVLATANDYPDALAGGPLARSLDAPLLLTPSGSLATETRAEIERLGASTVVMLGGANALSGAIEDELENDLGVTVERIAGVDRFHTAQLIAARVPATTVYLTEGANPDPGRGWPDAVAVSGLASFEQRPILLVTRTIVPDATRAALADLGVDHAVIVGGEAAVSAETEAAVRDPDGDGTAQVGTTREAGASRFATSVEVAKRSVAAGASTFDLWFATGLSFPDALAAGPAVARSGGVLLLVHGTAPGGGPEVYEWLESLDDADTLRAWFTGGVGAITDDVATKLTAAAGIN